jgi:phosphoglucosamine mutase
MNKNLFGTDGIRSTIGQFPLDRESLIRLGNAIAKWIIYRYGPNKRILLGHDIRSSTYFVKASLKVGLLSNPLIIFDGNILPTPTVSQLVEGSDQFVCGLILSASHNAYYDNGIKLTTSQGKLSEDDEQEISTIFYKKNNIMPLA